MLRKLLKYDLKATYLYLFVCYGVYFLLTLGFFLNIKTYIGTMGSGNEVQVYENGARSMEMLQTFATISLTILWGCSIVGLIILTYVLIVHRFYSNLAGAQGYLSLTLPVSTRLHMLSKLISGLLFELVSVVMVVCGLAVGASLLGVGSLWKQIGEMFLDLWQNIVGQFGLIYYVNVALGAIRGLLMIYFSICVGQLFNKHKIWGSIGTYLGLVIVLDLFVQVALIVVRGATGNLLWFASSGWDNVWFSVVYKLVQVLAFFFLGAWILEKKANLE